MRKKIDLAYQNFRGFCGEHCLFQEKQIIFLGLAETFFEQNRLTIHSKNQSIKRGILVHGAMRRACVNGKTKLTFHRYHDPKIDLSEVFGIIH
ncbi:hypothetical protein C7H19_21115 [Aphanothece hegewaldii CCALA 016]|uniref:Uncharacterized protein n=1 Tax=Aphanothece hegewaldii CCALA 016 TaxID=2107694 RepID=A0A2T1LSJ4_9CHRO|nr:hypothetical protein [Aphanothece hegewaldii]PSF32943.1 hypothetical protein C7H19_21115 [Aphanothece hegewaldii CCALA 016]